MQTQILLFFQEISTPVLDKAAEMITMLGEQYFFIIVISFIYWNVSKKEGFKLASAFIFSSMVNAVLKITFHTSRPFEKLGSISGKRIETATGYSFPSGHTQGATTFFITLSQIIRKKLFTIIAIIILLLVGISRVYLGVHWPVDVVAAVLIGIAVAYIFCSLIDNHYDDHVKLKRIFMRIQAVFILLTIIVLILDLTLFKGSIKIEDFFKISGISAGAVYGFFIEERYIYFSETDSKWVIKVIRFIIGLAGAIGIMAGVKLILPEHYLFDFFRYALVGLWTTFLWPAAGLGVNLFTRQSRI